MSDLHAAVRNDDLDAAKTMLRPWNLFRGSKLSALDDDGCAAIHLVRSPAMAGLLVERGADVNQAAGEKQSERTALHLCIERGDLQTAIELLAKGADPNAQDAKGNTPLHVAVSGLKEAAFIDLLVSKKSKIDAANHDGATAIVLAILAFPTDGDAKSDLNIHGRVIELIGALRMAGADCSITYQGKTPFDLARSRKCPWLKKVGGDEGYKVTLPPETLV